MIAFCAILLFAPQARSQSFEGAIRKKQVTISGTVGLSGVSMQGFPGTPMTDENGVYSVEVDYGWTGTVKPVRLGYEFVPSQRAYTTKVTSPMPDQDYRATLLTYTISGTVGQPDVKMSGFPMDVVSDQSGRYTATVDYGFTGVITPDKTGFRFNPISRPYNQVTKNFQDNYEATEVRFAISGSVGAPGVVMQGLPDNPKTDENGRYSAEVRYGATNIKVVPTKDGHLFTPEYREYDIVIEPQLNQDYSVQVLTYMISGSAGMPGVLLKGFPQETVTDENGYYSVTVTHGWDGKVIPEKPGYTFVPEFRPYSKVTASSENHDYNGNVVYLKIEGTTGIGGVALSGFPQGTVTSDEKGFYSTQVEYGWTGVVTPDKTGYFFTPADRQYSAITAPQPKQDFKGEKVYFEISGNVGQPGVQLKGLPGMVVSKADGSYTTKVDYNWDGTVTPTKIGFEFTPSERAYPGVLSPQTNNDYTARIIQHTISGKVLEKSGSPIPDVLITATGQVEPVTTGADGAFELKVDHGWKGRITAEKAGWILTPAVKPFDIMVTAPIANQMITGEIKMLTITNIIAFNGEPIQGVTVTAEPGPYTALTDGKGRYAVKVPYDWSGELSFFREDLDFTTKFPYMNVTEDIDGTKPPKPPVTPPQDTTRPVTPPQDTTNPVSTGRELLLQRIDKVNKQLEPLLNQATALTPASQAEMLALLRELNQLTQLLNAGGELPPGGATDLGPLAGGPATPKLLSVLKELSVLTNTQIAVDMTVKDEPVSTGAVSVQSLPMELALQQILTGTSKAYMFRKQPDGTYLVFQPLTNTFAGSDIRMALQDIAAGAEVPIIPDPNVGGTTTANFTDTSLEDALEMVLAATPYVFKRKANHYVVVDSSPENPMLMDVSETRYLRLNHNTPQRVKDLLPRAYQAYVQAEAINATDANDLGHILTVTAPKDIANRIMEIIRKLDLSRRQVLLDTRVVVMEKGNLLNLGVEWQFPTLQYGRFYNGDNWLTGLQVGYSPDETFTSSLMATLNLLESTNQADIVSNPQVIAQDGRQATLKSIQEEWFMMSDRQLAATGGFGYTPSELQKIESGTVLTIVPRIGDSNEITLEMAVEVSDSISRGAESDLPIVNRRQAKNSVTVLNGGTVAVAGLTENRTRQIDRRVPFFGSLPVIGRAFRNNDDEKATREIAVFVTATLIPDSSSMMSSRPSIPQGGPAISSQPQEAGAEFTDGIRAALRAQPQ